MKKILFSITILIILILPITSVAAKPKAVDTDPYSMIAEVNALRASYGLPAYTVSPILMATAQQHSAFMSANGVSHEEGGITFADRLANAGYPLGVFRSENISAGMNQSVQATVLQWQGDDLHWHTMMSPDLTEIGAGVTVVNGYAYYVIDCATPLGAKPPAVNTAAPGETQQAVAAAPVEIGPPLARTVVPSTPNADGRLVHVVGPGETLWLIAVTYKKTILEIRELNYMSDTDAIYPGEKLLIAKDVVVTPAPIIVATKTPSSFSDPVDEATAPPDLPMPTFPPSYTRTPLPTLPLPTDLAPTDVPATAPLAVDASVLIVGAIVLAALVLAGVLVYSGRKRD